MKSIIVTIFLVALLQVLLTRGYNYERQKIFIGPSKNVTNFTFGYKDALSSIFWVRVVQDFHVCDQKPEKVKYPGYRAGMDPVEDVLTRQLPQPTCENGWVYQMLDVISDLDPTFRSVFLDGGTMLSVMVDDREGASKIFRKGVEAYPNDWEVLYRAAYHELFEMQDAKAAEKLMYRAAENGAPQWTYSLAAKLSSRTGQAAMALSVLENVLDRDLAGDYRDRIELRIKELQEVLRKESAP